MEIALLAFHSIATLLFALAASLGFWVVTHQDEFGQSADVRCKTAKAP
jgi:hypothetical protein